MGVKEELQTAKVWILLIADLVGKSTCQERKGNAVTLDEFERLLAGAEERYNLEFKGAMTWDKHSIVKDVLAMANSVDGGRIVFGIQDGTLERQGLDDAQLATFDAETIRDQVAAYADPEVQCLVHKVTDGDAKDYVVFTISPFSTMPVICRQGGREVSAGRIYIRPRNGRPQSREVQTSAEMRDIIDRAIGANLTRYRELGFFESNQSPEQGDISAQFEEEIEDLK